MEDTQGAPTLNAWSEATASQPLNMTEMDELVKKSAQAWEVADAAKKVSSEAKAAAESIDAQIILALKDAGKKSYTVDGLGTVTIVKTPQVTTPKTAEEKKEFFAFLKRTGGEELLYAYATVNSQSLNSYYKAKFEEAKERGEAATFNIPGIGEPTDREHLSFRTKKG